MPKSLIAASLLILVAAMPARSADFPYLIGGRVSIATTITGAPADNRSYQTALSPDGGAAAFWSDASNLVPGIPPGIRHIYHKDLRTGVVTLVSRASDGTPADSYSLTPQISPDGQKVLFSSNAANLVPRDRNALVDVFERDLKTSKTRRVSLTAAGKEPNGASYRAVYSPDGKSIAFASYASNLVAGDTNGRMDVFVRDLTTGAIRRVSIVGKRQGNQDSFNPVFSGDGRTLAFVSGATNWKNGIAAGSLQVWTVALPSGTPRLVSTSAAGAPGNGMSLEPSLSPTGDRIVFETTSSNLYAGDRNSVSDIVLKTIADGSVRVISSDRNGRAGNAASQRPRFTFDGADIVFGSSASNLLSGDGNGQLDVFVKNLATGTLAALSKTAKGAFGFGYSFDAIPASKARVIAFTTTVAGIVPGDTTTLPHPVAMTLSPK